jgi:hypothetical protein
MRATGCNITLHHHREGADTMGEKSEDLPSHGLFSGSRGI